MLHEPKTQESVFASRWDGIESDLRTAKNTILELMQTDIREEFHQLRFVVSALICDAIYQGAKKWHDWGQNESFPFYFWPGYDSIRGSAQNERVSLHVEVLGTNITEEKPWHVECGISPAYQVSPNNGALSVDREELVELLKARKAGITSSLPKFSSQSGGMKEAMLGLVPGGGDDHFRILGNPTSIWFAMVLVPATKEECSNSVFSPGGTHPWLTGLNGKLKGLFVDFERPEADADRKFGCATGADDGFLICSLLPSDFTEAGPQLGEFLESWGGGVWPSSIHNHNDRYTNLRRRIYTPWLKAVFAPEKGNESLSDTITLLNQYPTELSYFKTRIQRLERTRADFEQRFSSFCPFIREKSRYKHWYSLALDPTISPCLASTSARKLSPLGTAMLFSGRKMDSMFLSIIRTWMEQLFAAFRLFEHAKHSAKVGEQQQRYSFSHEARGKINTILMDDNLGALSAYTQGVARVLSYDMLLWSNTTQELSFDHSEILLQDLRTMSLGLARMQLFSKLSSQKRLHRDLTDEDNSAIKSRLRTALFNDSIETYLRTIFAPSAFERPIRSRWKAILESILNCALRQALSHALIFQQRTILSSHQVEQLQVADIVQHENGGLVFHIRNYCIAPFEPRDTIEWRYIHDFVKLCDPEQQERIQFDWTLRREVNETSYLISAISIYDPTANEV